MASAQSRSLIVVNAEVIRAHRCGKECHSLIIRHYTFLECRPSPELHLAVFVGFVHQHYERCLIPDCYLLKMV